MTHPLTQREKVDCVACEGRPSPENNPCAVCGRTALASGSGDHAPVAWRVRLLDGGWVVCGYEQTALELAAARKGATVQALYEPALLAENAALRAERDQIRSLHNRATDRSRHWEIAALRSDARATEEERKLAEADRLLERIANDPTWDGPSSARLYFLSKEAERG